jgi:hypothetical protein
MGKKKKSRCESLHSGFFVPGAGLEPALPHGNRIFLPATAFAAHTIKCDLWSGLSLGHIQILNLGSSH